MCAIHRILHVRMLDRHLMKAQLGLKHCVCFSEIILVKMRLPLFSDQICM